MLTRDSKCSGPKRSNQQPRLQPSELQRVRVHPSTQRESRLQIALHFCTQFLRNRIIDLLLHRLLVVGNVPCLRLSGKHARLRAFLDLFFFPRAKNSSVIEDTSAPPKSTAVLV